MSVFNLSLKKQSKFITESYYQVEPEKELTQKEIKIIEALEKLNNTKAETNNAFNESEKANNHFAQAYKTIAPPEDYVPKTNNQSDGPNNAQRSYEYDGNSKLKEEELSKFSKFNELLKKQKSDGNNSKSTISFSLTDRKKVYIPIPIYLCEVDGKIVVTIKVNSQGSVTDAYLNTSSTSNNECLIEHAVEYAKQSQFSTDTSKQNQIGTITFYFTGKR